MSRKTEGQMPTTTRFDLGGEGLPRINLGGAGKRILQLAILVLVIILLMASTTSIPTGNVGVLTLFGRVTGETLPEGIHLINPLKSVQKLSVQTQSLKESANVPSNEGLILALDTSLLFRRIRARPRTSIRLWESPMLRRSWNRRYARRFARLLPRTPRTPCTRMLANWCKRKSKMS